MDFDPTLLPPRYQFVGELGHGGFGAVCRAVDLATGNTVAVKVLHRLDPDSRIRFQREVRLLQNNINNVFVVKVLDFWDGEQPALVMEYCQHGSLRARVGQVDWMEATAILAHATQGLHGIHAAGGFHRDLKPDNLLIADVDGERIVKVADFGVARVPITTEFPMTTSAAGTQEYLAPEVLRGGAFSAAGDVYALGLSIVELITGAAAVSAIRLVAGPQRFTTLLRRMLHPIPGLRPSTREVAGEIDELIQLSQRPRAASNGALKLLGLIGVAGLVGGALAALAAHDDRTWDASVQRYRRRDGTFA